MANVTSTTTEYRIAVSEAEFLNLLVQKAKDAGLLPAGFTPNKLQTYEAGAGQYDIVFTEVS
jgi:hypothetical protein